MHGLAAPAISAGSAGGNQRGCEGRRGRCTRDPEKGPSRQPGWRKLRAAAEAAADAASARKPEEGRERGEGSREKPLVKREPYQNRYLQQLPPHLNFCIGISYRLQMMRARKYCHVCRIQMNSSSYAKHMKTKHGNTTTTPGAASFFAPFGYSGGSAATDTTPDDTTDDTFRQGTGRC